MTEEYRTKLLLALARLKDDPRRVLGPAGPREQYERQYLDVLHEAVSALMRESSERARSPF